MKLDRENLRSLILNEIKNVLLEVRDAASAREYFEKRKDPNLSDVEKSALKDEYKIAKIEDKKEGERLIKRVTFKMDPIDVDVTPEKEEN